MTPFQRKNTEVQEDSGTGRILRAAGWPDLISVQKFVQTGKLQQVLDNGNS